MSVLAALKAATTLTDVAALLGFKPAALSYVLYKKDGGSKYIKFDIPKRYGGTRLISAPTAELKLIQRRLADLLQDCADEINKANNFSDSISHGFKRKRSIITNAREHRRRRFVFNIDLANFFGTINFGRVRGFFIKEKNFTLNEKVATVLAQIICFENALPQGSPCSPVMSNLIAHILDIHLVRLAARSGCTYTRYADDLTFSTNSQRFPESIAECTDTEAHTWVVGSKVQGAIGKCGFEINHAKTRMQYCNSRQEVTGLTVNRRVGARREYRHTMRAMVHRLVNTGTCEFVSQVSGIDGEMVVQKNVATPSSCAASSPLSMGSICTTRVSATRRGKAAPTRRLGSESIVASCSSQSSMRLLALFWWARVQRTTCTYCMRYEVCPRLIRYLLLRFQMEKSTLRRESSSTREAALIGF